MPNQPSADSAQMCFITPKTTAAIVVKLATSQKRTKSATITLLIEEALSARGLM